MSSPRYFLFPSRFRWPRLVRGALLGVLVTALPSAIYAALQRLGKGRFMKKTLCLVLAALMVAGPFGPPPPARAQIPPPIGSEPAPLIDQFQLNPLTLHAATDAQRLSLENLEQEAVANTILAHGLPASDAVAVQTWGRDDALAELWALIAFAIDKPQCTSTQTPEEDDCRTADEQNAVEWLAAVAQRDAVRAAQFAGLEYVKWAGLEEAAYWALLETNPSETDLRNFLHQGFDSPKNYAGEVSECPANTTCRTEDGRTFTEGFCVYQPPAPYQSDYSDRGHATCTIPCVTCPNPFGPSFDELVDWGAADAHSQLVNTSGHVEQINRVAIGVGFGVGAAAVVTALSLSAVLLPASTAWAAGAAATAIFPFAASIGVTIAGVASLILFAVAAAVVAAIYAVEFFEAEAVPGQLAKFITGAPTTPLDLPGMLDDAEQLRGLFSLFIGATLPTPYTRTCNFRDGTGTRCLNPPPIPAASSQTDPLFQVQLNSGTADAPVLGTPTNSSTITWKDTARNTTTTARLTGNWFVNTVTASDQTTSTLQTLRMHYTDWNGSGHTAWLTNFPSEGYKFLSVADQGPSGTPLNVATCLADHTCAYSPTIKYVGADGTKYQTQVLPPPVPTVSANWSPLPVVEGSPAQFHAVATSPIGATITSYTWRFEDKTPNTACLPSPCMVTVSGKDPEYTFPMSGPFQGRLTVTDSDGRTATTSFTVQVTNVPPVLTLYTACNPLIICLPPNNVLAVPLGTETTLGGTIKRSGSLDREIVDIDWGDGSAHDISSHDFSLCPFDGSVFRCSPNLQLGSVGGLTYTFTGKHTYASAGQYTVTVKVTDRAGATDTETVTETVLIVTATTLASSPNPSVVGQGVTYTATVSPAPNGGTVAFLDGGSAIAGCTAQTLSGGTATCTAAASTAASHSVTAAYGGNATYAKSTSAAVSQTVNPAATSTSVDSSVSPLVWGQAVTFTAAVAVTSPGAGSPSGTVTFKDGGSAISGCAAQAVNTSTGQATCTTSALSVAGHSIIAAYGGDTNFTSSTSAALTQTVNRAATSTAVSSSKSPSTQGESVTFTATVAVTAPGAGTPTGTVTFKDGATTLGTGTLSTSDGVTKATFATSSLGTGTHSITASYGGDGNFFTSTSTALTQYVNVDLSKYPKLANGAYNLSNTNLSGAYFIGVSLVGANLSGSNLTGTVFTGADLTGANLSNSNYFGGANFTDAILRNANLSNSNFKGANFTGADLTGANLTNATLKGAKGLTAAMLTGVIWNKTTCPDGTVSNRNGGTCVGHL